MIFSICHETKLDFIQTLANINDDERFFCINTAVPKTFMKDIVFKNFQFKAQIQMILPFLFEKNVCLIV